MKVEVEVHQCHDGDQSSSENNLKNVEFLLFWRLGQNLTHCGKPRIFVQLIVGTKSGLGLFEINSIEFLGMKTCFLTLEIEN